MSAAPKNPFLRCAGGNVTVGNLVCINKPAKLTRHFLAGEKLRWESCRNLLSTMILTHLPAGGKSRSTRSGW